MYFAHSENNSGYWHPLNDHLSRTAELMSAFAHRTSFQNLFFITGLLHDAGKFQDAFQAYLKAGGGRKIPHAVFGAMIARSALKRYLPLPYVIDGHHAGIPDTGDLKTHLQELDEHIGELEIVHHRWTSEIKTDERSLQDIGGSDVLPTDRFELELFTRYLYSALTDADWLDTEQHFQAERRSGRVSFVLEYERMLGQLAELFSNLPAGGAINRLRTQAREEACAHAQEDVGFFSLTLPTGLGKTITSLYWALLHAKHHSLKRIIIVLPFINIIDQTAALLKNIFGEAAVLEHHSGVIDEAELGESQGCSPKRLACENWDYPIIITTSVQFFETLFSNRPFKCRKLHNISESVVIFDEIQTLPKTLSEPTVTMLKNVSSVMRASMLFCTATQPAFLKREGFDGIEKIVPLIEDLEKYFKASERVRYSLHKKCAPDTVENVAAAVCKKNASVLVIANTKKAAKELYDSISAHRAFERTYHLSTSMCPSHRRAILSSVKQDLSSRLHLCVVSTQLIEAGVDIDFPCVYRALAPLDGLIQSAGRCNRNGAIESKGEVVLFDLIDATWPDRSYRACAEFTKSKILDDLTYVSRYESFGEYYTEVLRHLIDQDRSKINDERAKFNFQAVNDRYHVIQSQTAPLFIVGYNEESRALFDSMTKEDFIPKELYRRAQEFIVLVYPDFIKKYSAQIETLHDALYIWHGSYSNESGIEPENMNVEKFIC